MREPFYENYLAKYYYDEDTNEIQIGPKSVLLRLEASVFIETLADLIKEISKVQSLSKGEG